MLKVDHATMMFAGPTSSLILNPSCDRARAYGNTERAILSLAGAEEAYAAISRWPGYAPTPLRSLPGFASDCNVAEVLYKDEGHRFELMSFKALGGAYAVERLVAERGRDGVTVTCATDGNHGRSVAWGARRAGIRAVIYVHEGVSQGRADAIASFGAEVRREGAHYDDSVRASTAAAAANGWHIISDTSWPGYEETPKAVMQGYAVLAKEIEAQGGKPTHVFVQGGVGGLAAGVLSYRWEKLGSARPIMTVVEPDKAACLFKSAEAGSIRNAEGDLDTVMAGLACGEPSILAWQLLSVGADAFMAIPDEAAIATMRDLAAIGIVGGESGVAGLAGFRVAAANPNMRDKLKLTPQSRIVIYGTEGATDPAVYRALVGKTPDEVAGKAASS
ncbi:MAG: diaminopropionate ammonia-lyase [Bosea sp. (in: a-proteobacteria)]